jgi:hypothetical protein
VNGAGIPQKNEEYNVFAMLPHFLANKWVYPTYPFFPSTHYVGGFSIEYSIILNLEDIELPLWVS